jgi:hypothetical protein
MPTRSRKLYYNNWSLYIKNAASSDDSARIIFWISRAISMLLLKKKRTCWRLLLFLLRFGLFWRLTFGEAAKTYIIKKTKLNSSFHSWIYRPCGHRGPGGGHVDRWTYTGHAAVVATVQQPPPLGTTFVSDVEPINVISYICWFYITDEYMTLNSSVVHSLVNRWI